MQPDRADLRTEVGFFQNWDGSCRDKLITGNNIKLHGDLLAYAEKFDYTIFDHISLVSLVEQHATTPFHTVRFGGGLPPRGRPGAPPEVIDDRESRYIAQLFA